MSDGYIFAFQSTDFPVSQQPSDVVSQTLLRFFSNVLQINLGTSFAADAVKCGLTHANATYMIDGYMVPQHISFPPSPTLQATSYKFPLLSVYRQKREFEQFSNMKLMIKSDYLVNFILPPLSAEQYNVMFKYLALASDVLIDRAWRGYDINYNNGEQVWITAKIAYCLLDKDEYGSFLGQDGKTEFPSVRLHMSVMEESQFVDSNYPSMQNAFVQTNLYDGYNLSLPFDNIADGYSNPNLAITSLSVGSGSVNGGTIINIIGDGFFNITPSQVASFAVTLNGAPVNKIVVKSNTSLLVVSGPGATTGTGNVVITDRLNNQTTLMGSWTYT